MTSFASSRIAAVPQGGGDLDSQAPRSEAVTPGLEAETDRRALARIPHIIIQIFCETPEVAAATRHAAADRLMARAGISQFGGGVDAAMVRYAHEATPQLIIIETCGPPGGFLTQIDRLAEVCDPGTKVVVIGHVNDVSFYRELKKRGVSDYLVAPIDPLTVISTVSEIYGDTSTRKLGHSIAFIGAKGGVGSSTIAHNVSWTIAGRMASNVVLADLDLAFGTASLNFKLDPGPGVEEALGDAERLDEVLLDRLLSKCTDHLSLLRAPGTLEKCYDLTENAVDPLIEIAQASVPFLALDLPHVWNAWARQVLLTADEIIITASPDLPNLRNAKSLISLLKRARPNDPPPKLILNQVGVPKRPEIKPAEFAKIVDLDLLASIPFDPHLFGRASNEGKMVAEVSARSPASRVFADIAGAIAERQQRSPKGNFNIGSLIRKMTFGSKRS
jgi:pilus assembly protein CpaE